MAIYSQLTQAYTKAIYLDGTKRFPDIRPEYVVPVKQHAATKYTLEQIGNTIAQSWITEQEYNETIAYVLVE